MRKDESRMLHLSPFWFCTNSVPGDDLIPALDAAREFGFSDVELSAIDGISEQIVAERVCDEYVAWVRARLEERGLRCVAVSGHCDLTNDRQFARFLKKLEFAGKIGATRINTRCGPVCRTVKFRKNLSRAVEAAAPYRLRINLESYGDIVGTARECGPIFREIGHPSVRCNYDPGNNYRFARGEISIADDICESLEVLDCLHLKDALLRDGYIYNPPIGQGGGVRAVFRAERSAPPSPAGWRCRKLRVASDFAIEQLTPAPEEVRRAIRESLDFIAQNCAVWHGRRGRRTPKQQKPYAENLRKAFSCGKPRERSRSTRIVQPLAAQEHGFGPLTCGRHTAPPDRTAAPPAAG
ncbi:MAG: sugar phosphate isomerase/epimerase family protein [Anaerotruncus massiliensis (ex Togo et al. 2019)]